MVATKAKSRGSGKTATGGDAQMLVQMFRVVTDEQFDFWITCLNRAAAANGGRGNVFTRDDRQKTISYWYLLMYLLETYAAGRNPFEVRSGETWLSEGLVSMKTLASDFKERFKEETIRRYVFDLKQYGLIAIEGRGPEAMLQLSSPAIVALTDTIRQWVTAFRDVDRRVQKMRVM